MQSLNQEYLNLHQFLGPYASIWQHEPMASYPTNLDSYSQEWLDEFTHSNQLFELYAKTLDYRTICSSSLSCMLKQAEELEQIPSISMNARQDDLAISKDFLTVKKAHELNNFLPFLKDQALRHKCSRVYDVGSGHGHLGRSLTSLINLPVICWEKNDELILQGQIVAEKQGKQGALTFLKQDLRPDFLNFAPSSPLSFLASGPAMLVGLHTCGNLALSQMLLAMHSARYAIGPVINVPCCYFHLHPQHETNLSLWAQENPIAWTPQALTLATRAHRRDDHTEYLAMARVKEYRYTLQLFLHDELGILDFFPVGSANKKLYQKSFEEYASKKFQELGLKLPPQNTFEKFYQALLTQKKVRNLFLMTLIRWRFGRVLEKALLIDRALWMQQYGFQTELSIIFNESLSPRNIVLSATE